MTARIYNAYRETLVRIANGEEPAKDIAAAVLNLQRLQRGRKVASLQGRRFGRLTVVERVENDGAGKSRWLCVCDCGTQKNNPQLPYQGGYKILRMLARGEWSRSGSR